MREDSKYLGIIALLTVWVIISGFIEGGFAALAIIMVPFFIVTVMVPSYGLFTLARKIIRSIASSTRVDQTPFGDPLPQTAPKIDLGLSIVIGVGVLLLIGITPLYDIIDEIDTVAGSIIMMIIGVASGTGGAWAIESWRERKKTQQPESPAPVAPAEPSLAQPSKPKSISKLFYALVVVAFVVGLVWLVTGGFTKPFFQSYVRNNGVVDNYVFGIHITAARVFMVLPTIIISLVAYWKLIKNERTINYKVIGWGVLFWVIPLVSPLAYLGYFARKKVPTHNPHVPVAYQPGNASSVEYQPLETAAKASVGIVVTFVILFWLALFMWAISSS